MIKIKEVYIKEEQLGSKFAKSSRITKPGLYAVKVNLNTDTVLNVELLNAKPKMSERIRKEVDLRTIYANTVPRKVVVEEPEVVLDSNEVLEEQEVLTEIDHPEEGEEVL